MSLTNALAWLERGEVVDLCGLSGCKQRWRALRSRQDDFTFAAADLRAVVVVRTDRSLVRISMSFAEEGAETAARRTRTADEAVVAGGE